MRLAIAIPLLTLSLWIGWFSARIDTEPKVIGLRDAQMLAEWNDAQYAREHRESSEVPGFNKAPPRSVGGWTGLTIMVLGHVALGLWLMTVLTRGTRPWLVPLSIIAGVLLGTALLLGLYTVSELQEPGVTMRVGVPLFVTASVISLLGFIELARDTRRETTVG